MNNQTYIVLIISLFLINANAEVSPHILTFFIRPIPKTLNKKNDIEKLKEKIKKPEKVLKSFLVNNITSYPQAGIYSTYAGYSTISNFSGQISFPRKTAKSKINLIITQDIKPLLINPFKSSTIRGFVINPKSLIQAYTFEKKFDNETQLYVWEVKEQGVEKDDLIPYDTILLMANPKNIIVPIGKTSTIEGENFVLPDLYITKNPDSILNTLRFFKNRQYFNSVKFKYEFQDYQYQQRVTN